MAMGIDMPSAVLLQIQPIADVPSYLKTRKPVAHYDSERALFITLPEHIRADLRWLLLACQHAQGLVKAGLSVTKSVQRAYILYRSHLSISQKSLREKYDDWVKSGDWVTLVNLTKAGARWQDRDISLPDAFLAFCETFFGKFVNKYGRRQAIFALHRQWTTGRNLKSEREPIPGYGFWQDWVQDKYPGRPFAEAPIPEGWTYGNILRQITARGKYTKAVEALLHEGTSAAREHLPQHMSTRKDLRFLELVTFDDLRTDWHIMDPESGQPCELWLLIARDHATSMVLGFVMHPSRKRKDGSSSRLGLTEMKQLAAWLLEIYPLPPYQMIWRLERGTATLPQPIIDALQEMLPKGPDGSSRIAVRLTSMIGGRSPAGYIEKAKGNSRGKASHESLNRLFHTQLSYIGGQIGAHYDIRPAELDARGGECVTAWKLAQRLPENLRGKVQYNLLLPEQAREHLFSACIDQNFRTDHKLENFERVLEWWNPDIGKWCPQNTWDGRPGMKFRKRMEMPVERAVKLMAPYIGQWSKVSPEVITALLAHTIRHVAVEESGEAVLTIEDKKLRFSPPPQITLPLLRQVLPASQKALAYFSSEDPAFLHLTNGKGVVIGTWFRRRAIGFQEQELLQQAMRYTETALKTARSYAASLAEDRRSDTDAIRANNAQLAEIADTLDRGPQFNQIATTTNEVGTLSTASPLSSPVASSLIQTRTAIKAAAKQTKRDTADARDLLRKAANNF